MRLRQALPEPARRTGLIFYGDEHTNVVVPVQGRAEELDQEIAATKLATMGLAIDKLTAEQAAYANDYSAGT